MAGRKLHIFLPCFSDGLRIWNFASLEIIWNKEIGLKTESFVCLCRHSSHFPLASFQRRHSRKRIHLCVFVSLCWSFYLSFFSCKTIIEICYKSPLVAYPCRSYNDENKRYFMSWINFSVNSSYIHHTGTVEYQIFFELRYKWTQKWHSVGASIASSLLLEMQFWTQAMLGFSCRTQKHLRAIVQKVQKLAAGCLSQKVALCSFPITTCCKGLSHSCWS